MRKALIIAGLGLMSAVSHAGADPIPVVLAVDTSRSLSAVELTASGEALRAMVRQLPADTPVGVVEFGDDVRWLAQPDSTRERALKVFDALVPTGGTTLLNDALFQSAKALSGGGVIVLASDGRDENSATTPDDVARLCGDNHVRIVAMGVGRKVDERALRRLSLLTDGGYVAARPLAGATDLLIAVERARRGVAEQLAKLAVAPAAPVTPGTAANATASAKAVAPTAAPAVVPTPEAVPPGISLPMWIPALLALLAIAAGAAILLWRRQRREEARVCERCGMPLESWDVECPHCRAEAERNDSAIREREDRERLAQAVAEAAPVHDDDVEEDSNMFVKAPLDELVDKTFVLGEQAMLIVKEHRKPPHTIQLAPDPPFTVGRAVKVNSLVLADPTLSAQHFRIVFKDGAYFIADLDTTNGTLVNGERIHVHKLRAGDQIHAGEVDFEFRVQYLKRN